MSNTYIDVHVLQTVPPSNLNRDDAGSPKQAVFGGVRRSRVSSQAWKRATRRFFVEGMDVADRSTRTKRISALLTERLIDRTDLDREGAARLATSLLKPLDIKPGKKEAETAYLLFFGLPQLEAIVDLVADRAGDLVGLDDDALAAELKDLPVREQLEKGHPVDVALFGRMVADIPALNVDAATQVAHAISTHSVEIEFDYFTAVDDEKTLAEDDAGAAMIGTVEFNSSTLYRYATVGLDQLVENLGGDREAATDAVVQFVEGFVRSMPTGHQNTFAHRTLPSTVLVVVREDQPVNLVSAFERPVRSRDGLVDESSRRLAAEFARSNQQWASEPLLTVALFDESSLGDDASVAAAYGPSLPFPELLAQLRGAVESRQVASL